MAAQRDLVPQFYQGYCRFVFSGVTESLDVPSEANLRLGRPKVQQAVSVHGCQIDVQPVDLMA